MKKTGVDRKSRLSCTDTQSFSPLTQLLSERTAPESLYLEAKFSPLISYGLTVDLFQEVVPIGQEKNAATVRNNMNTITQRIEGENGENRVMFIDCCERDWEQLPRPDMPLTIGLDGGYVHSYSQRSRKDGWFKVIASKGFTAEGSSKRFASFRATTKSPSDGCLKF